MEKAADRFWQEFDRRCKRAAPRRQRKQQSHPPGEGYCCNICGKEGGYDDSHWIQFCPDKNKPKPDDTSSTDATVAESEAEPQHHSPDSDAEEETKEEESG